MPSSEHSKKGMVVREPRQGPHYDENGKLLNQPFDFPSLTVAQDGEPLAPLSIGPTFEQLVQGGHVDVFACRTTNLRIREYPV